MSSTRSSHLLLPREAASTGVFTGSEGPRHSYTDAELERLRAMLEDAQSLDPGGPSYVLFNNLPRIADARRFLASTGHAPGARRETARKI